MKKMLTVSNSFTRTMLVLLASLALGFIFWTATTPVANAQAEDREASLFRAPLRTAAGDELAAKNGNANKEKGKEKEKNQNQVGGAGGKCTVCHRPPGNPSNSKTLSIGCPAVQAHLNHGDSVGECQPTPTQNP